MWLAGATLFGTLHILMPDLSLSAPTAGLVMLVFLLSAMLYIKTKFIQERYFSILKLSYSSILNLWKTILLHNFLLLGLGVSIGFATLYFFKVPLWESASLGTIVSSVFFVLIIMCGMDGSQIVEQLDRHRFRDLGVAKSVLFLCGALFFATFCIWIFVELSPLVAVFTFTLVFGGCVFLLSDELVKTIPSRRRWHLYFGFSMVVSLLQVLLGYADYRYSRTMNYIVVPKNTWAFSDIEKVKTIEDWVYWQNKSQSLDALTPEEIIASYDRLQMLCPPRARDNTLAVDCVGEERLTDYQYTGLKVRSDEEVLQLLSAPTEYAQMVGIFYARRLPKPLSRDLILAIEYIAEREGNIQGLAKNTMSESYSKEYRGGFTVRVERAPAPVEE